MEWNDESSCWSHIFPTFPKFDASLCQERVESIEAFTQNQNVCQNIADSKFVLKQSNLDIKAVKRFKKGSYCMKRMHSWQEGETLLHSNPYFIKYIFKNNKKENPKVMVSNF